MPLTNELAVQSGTLEPIFSDLAVETAMTIERILERANEIRRARGGLFGYDFEDWLQATRELTENVTSAQQGPDHTSHACGGL